MKESKLTYSSNSLSSRQVPARTLKARAKKPKDNFPTWALESEIVSLVPLAELLLVSLVTVMRK